MALTAVWGWTVERIAYRPLRESFRLAPLITAIGMSIVLQNFIQVSQGARVKPLPARRDRRLHAVRREGDFAVNLSNIQILIVVTTLVLMTVFWLIITRTALGRVAARLRAGPADGGAARRQCRPHDLADLRASARRSPPSPGCCTCSITA